MRLMLLRHYVPTLNVLTFFQYRKSLCANVSLRRRLMFLWPYVQTSFSFYDFKVLMPLRCFTSALYVLMFLRSYVLLYTFLRLTLPLSF